MLPPLAHNPSALMNTVGILLIFGLLMVPLSYSCICLAGFVVIHSDGSCAMLYVDEAYRGRSIGMSLEAFIINTVKNNGYVPFGHVCAENTVSLQMQEKLGLYLSETPIWWLRKK